MGFVLKIVGKKGFESLERSGEASSSSSGPAGEEAGRRDIKVHAGSCSSSGQSQGSSRPDVHGGAGCAGDAQ